MQYEKIDSSRWYALFVVTGEEDRVKERLCFKLKDSNLKVIVPKRRLKERKDGRWEYKIRTLFPGYVLLNGYMAQEDYDLFKDTPGVIKLLKDKYGALEIDEYEISQVKRLICNNEIIGCSRIYLNNDSVIVIDGPLLGMEGFIESIDKRKGRAKVRLNLMGEARVVELSVEMVQPA